jgi:hypothetical protein
MRIIPVNAYVGPVWGYLLLAIKVHRLRAHRARLQQGIHVHYTAQ